MSLPDYYKILQVTVSATSGEIKAAYRRLAKIYHPDKNPGHASEDHFKQIKEAYENLIDPQRRARYDAKRNRATTFNNPAREKKSGKKSYNFTEEDAKRRQYYQQHYKKSQSTTARPQPPEQPKPQSELKYILISVPLAVALLLLIIRMYEKPRTKKAEKISMTDTLRHSEINTPEMPFKGSFKEPLPDTNSASVLRLVNRSGYDAIVFLQNEADRSVRHHFIGDHYQLLAEHLRPGNYHLYFWMGKNFSYKRFLFDSILGNFSQTITVDSVPLPVMVSGQKNDTTLVDLENHNTPDLFLLKRIFRLQQRSGA
jgi:hypothetical protein